MLLMTVFRFLKIDAPNMYQQEIWLNTLHHAHASHQQPALNDTSEGLHRCRQINKVMCG